MRTILNILVGFGTALSLLALLSCTKEDPTSYRPIQEEKQEQENGETTMPEKISITISGVTLQIVLENNVATRELVTALKVSPITYKASDYGGFEKVGALGRSLPTANSQITTQAGMLSFIAATRSFSSMAVIPGAIHALGRYSIRLSMN